jgi:ABC-type nitrate/sulfonate/bicarbonate transport system substrate-binding protein
MSSAWQIMDRRSALALLMGSVALPSAFAHAAETPEQSTLEIGVVRDLQGGIQIAIAAAKGYFKEEGIDVKPRWVEQAGDLYPILASSALDLAGLGIHAVMILRGRKAQVKVICTLCEYSGSQGFVLRPGLKLNSPPELVGKKIAAPSTSPLELALAKFGKLNNFDSTKVTLVKMEPSESIVALARGDVDGALSYQPHLYKMQQMGGTLYWTGRIGYMTGQPEPFSAEDRLLYIHATLAVNEPWLAANPKTAAAVVRGIIRANDLIKNNPAETEKILRELYRAEPEAIKQALAQNEYGVSIDAGIARSISFANDWLVSNKRIPETQNPKDIIAPQILKKINPTLVNLA